MPKPRKKYPFGFGNYKMADLPSKFVIDLKPQEEPDKISFLDKAKNKFDPEKFNFKFSFNPERLEKLKKSKYSRLAVFSFGLFIFRIILAALKLVFYLSYGTGWLMIFFLKFAYHSTFALVRPLVIGSTWVFEKFAHLILALGKIFIRLAKEGILFPVTLVKSLARISKSITSGIYESRERKKTEKFESAREEKQVKLDEAPAFKNIPQPVYARQPRAKKEIHWRVFIPKFRAKSFKSAFSFLTLIIILVLPLKAFTYYQSLNLPEAKGKVLGESMDAFGNMLSAGQALSGMQFNQASENFSKASAGFLAAENQLKEINDALFVLAGMVPDENLKLASEGKNIVRAGQLASELGKDLTEAMNILFALTQGNENGRTLVDILNSFNPKISQAKIIAHELNAVVKKINLDNIPEEQRDKFSKVIKYGLETESMLNDLESLSATMNKILGGEEKKRYLLIFQNNAEMRGSGGFLGSYAILDMDKGKIASLEVPGGGGYDTKGALTKFVEAPEAMRILGARWFFWDANWWPDWTLSARKLMWFYENSDGSTVDGVIALTPTVMEKLLAITGPIDLTAEYGVVITAENFWAATQTITESDSERLSGTPKKIIGDLMKKLMDELPKKISKENFTALAQALESSLNEKQILVYLTDEGLEKEMEKYGWDAKMSETSGDYLMVANTNIGGQKTDKVIRQTIRHQAEIDKDGYIVDTLKIIREHTGVKGEPFTGVQNVDWMRVYVPLGSELLEAYGYTPIDQSLYKESYSELTPDPDVASGEGQAKVDHLSQTKIYNELGKTVFANWSLINTGETAQITLKYRLPFKLINKEVEQYWKDRLEEFFNPGQTALYPYSLMAEKQPGSASVSINSSLILDPALKIVWQYPESLAAGQAGWKIEDNLDLDRYWGAIIEADY